MEVLNDVLGTSIPPVYLDERPGDVKDSAADVTQAREVLKFDPPVDLPIDGVDADTDAGGGTIDGRPISPMYGLIIFLIYLLGVVLRALQ